MVTLKAGPIEEKSAGNAGELEEYKDGHRDAKLDDYSSVKVEMRNGEMGVCKGWRGGLDPSYRKVEDGEVGWIPVVGRWRMERWVGLQL